MHPKYCDNSENNLYDIYDEINEDNDIIETPRSLTPDLDVRNIDVNSRKIIIGRNGRYNCTNTSFENYANTPIRSKHNHVVIKNITDLKRKVNFKVLKFKPNQIKPKTLKPVLKLNKTKVKPITVYIPKNSENLILVLKSMLKSKQSHFILSSC